MRSDKGKYFGSLLMFTFAGVAVYRWYYSHLIFFLLLVFRDILAGWFFLKRKQAIQTSNKRTAFLAYVSSAIPLFYFQSSTINTNFILASDLLAILGFMFVVLATIELGTSIGISPAKREYVNSGIYKWIKHPMYLGYGISELGLILINPYNGIFFFVSSLLYWYRARTECLILQKS